MPEIEVALYINHKGMPVTHSSYSSRQTFKHCPRQFQLTRIEGWSDKVKRAAPLFGKCTEAGVQFYEENNRRAGSGVERFVQMWNEVKELPEFKELQFTATEKSWESLLRAGTEMMLLYEIRAPFLPISTTPKVLFQQVLRKKLFPGTEYDKLENKAVYDMLSFPRWNHKLLPPIDHVFGCDECAQRKLLEVENGGPEFVPCVRHEFRSLIIDIKTSGVDLNSELVVLDPQLAEYAWQGRIPDVGFLWFVKHGHEARKASRITLLKDNGNKHAGFELLVLLKDGDEESEQAAVYAGDTAALAAYEKATKGIRGNALKEAKSAFMAAGLADGTVLYVPVTDFTKQRLQFAAARLTTADMDETGRDAAQVTAEMLRAHADGYYPKLSGIRFPNQKCNFCAMRFICLNQPEKRDQLLTRRGEEWLDGNIDEDVE